mgnify:CR=1 FL=1
MAPQPVRASQALLQATRSAAKCIKAGNLAAALSEVSTARPYAESEIDQNALIAASRALRRGDGPTAYIKLHIILGLPSRYQPIEQSRKAVAT